MSEPDLTQIKAVSNRSNVIPMEALAELYSTADVPKRVLMAFGSQLLSQFEHGVAKACEQAVHQAVALLKDPDFAQRKKASATKRRSEKAEKLAAQRRQAELESIDPEAIILKRARELRDIESMLSYHVRSVKEYQDKRQAFMDGKETYPSRLWDKASRA